MILGKNMETWKNEYPLLNEIIDLKEVIWINENTKPAKEVMNTLSVSESDVEDARARLERFASFFMSAFPETIAENGKIESPTVRVDKYKSALENFWGEDLKGQLLLKLDSHLKVSGSIKARGGFYEVLKHAEDLALENGLISLENDYKIFDTKQMREFFSKYAVQVGSTGNLGLSIGIMSAKIGFRVTVHMSADARQWKKDLLRSKGVTVIEYADDYSKAVEEGRKLSDQDPNSYFVDDENSKNLFLGYSVAGKRLKKQLDDMDIKVDDEHPLFVYLPCGVGGGPGGVAFGLKLVYGDNVHFFFAEPTHSPCMFIGNMTKLHDKVSVQDFGIDNVTAADGLAVGRASGFVGKTLENLTSGCFTVTDENMYRLLSLLADSENIYLEPSALAGVSGINKLQHSLEGKAYIKSVGFEGKEDAITHLSWATGGSMVPEEMMQEYYNKGKSL